MCHIRERWWILRGFGSKSWRDHFGRHWRRWDDNTKIGLREIGWEGVDLIHSTNETLLTDCYTGNWSADRSWLFYVMYECRLLRYKNNTHSNRCIRKASERHLKNLQLSSSTAVQTQHCSELVKNVEGHYDSYCDSQVVTGGRNRSGWIVYWHIWCEIATGITILMSSWKWS
jgi:hypothetical protein